VKNLKATLQNKLKDAKKIALLGIGSELRGDDAAGIIVAKLLDKPFRGINKKIKFKVFIGETAPENLTGEIKRFAPTHMIIVDSADLKKKTGQIALLDPENTTGVSFCTHQLPFKIMADYLYQAIKCEIMIIGIQPGRLDFGSVASKEIKKSAKSIADIIKEVLMSTHTPKPI
jgi:hydrogenase 3 maturation protease